ncbi:hypothetical protein [Nocardioides sp. AX2bis]|uniref:hypothetical protein n=1 Tax=Nocardioides sp. AX2bis TaxID=2653157 RepID=UPI0012EF1520|nr:hypothetical protein [Nocardioides sp. AX2bis]VXB70277.1 conserved exported hypothetical protein [Nocardioides sp. AX2bis]
MRPSRSRHLAALLALACVGAACSPGTGQGGGDSSGGDREVERARCVVADPEGELLLQVWSVRAPDGGLGLADVALVDGLNLEVVDAVAVPFAGTPGTQGVVLDYPPRKDAGLVDGLARWEDRRPLDDLRLRPRDGEQALLVALRLSDPTTLGHLTGTSVGTRTDRGVTVTEHPQPLLVKPHDQPCRVDDPDEVADW